MKQFLLLFLYLTFLGEVLMLTCYKCDTTTDKESCGDKSMSTADCKVQENGEMRLKDDPPQCVQIRAYGEDDKEYITRDCVLANMSDACTEYARESGFLMRLYQSDLKLVQCTICHNDKCNNVSKQSSVANVAIRTTGCMFLAVILITAASMF